MQLSKFSNVLHTFSLRSLLRSALSRMPFGKDYLTRCFDSASHRPKPRKKRVKPVSLSLYFGVPGAGKSTFAAYLAKKDMKRGRPVWSNSGITGAYKCEKNDWGKYLMTDGRLIIDEAGLEFDNRKMQMTDSEIYFFKYHRHYQLDIHIKTL